MQVQENNQTSAESKTEIFKQTVFEVCPDFKVTDENKQLLNDIYSWCNGVQGKYNPDKGLWLWGSIGTGKSTLMRIISAYQRKIYPSESKKDIQGNYYNTVSGGFLIMNCTKVTADYANNGIDELERYTSFRDRKSPSAFCFDELGREPMPAKYFGTELNVMQYIFQARYELRHDCKTHITTNLSPEGAEKLYDDYIADRVREMFNVIEMKGKSFRK